MAAYLASLQDALADLSLAQAEAEAELPEEIKKEHWLMCKHQMSASAWEELWMKHRLFPLKALAEIAVMQARGQVVTEWSEVDNGKEPNLSLGKVRATHGS